MSPRRHYPISLQTPTQAPHLSQGEPFLTIRQFLLLLEQEKIRVSRRTLYRWLDVPKEHLPKDLQTLLQYAPSLWFLQFEPPLSATLMNTTHAIPIRYLRESSRTLATPLALNYVEPHEALRTVRSLRVMLNTMHKELLHLEHYVHALHGKDEPHEHGTTRHSLTA